MHCLRQQAIIASQLLLFSRGPHSRGCVPQTDKFQVWSRSFLFSPPPKIVYGHSVDFVCVIAVPVADVFLAAVSVAIGCRPLHL